MCLTLICKACGEPYKATDMRKVTCDNPECRANSKKLRLQRANRAYAKRCYMKNRKQYTCLQCGKVIPMETHRHKYCSDKCCDAYNHSKILKAKREYNRKLRGIKFDTEKANV